MALPSTDPLRRARPSGSAWARAGRRGLLALIACPLALSIGACRERGPIRVIDRDSAGVRIVASGLRERVPPTAFRLSASPRAQLRVPPADTVEAVAAPVIAGTLLPSGEVALLTPDGRVVRYDREGEPRWSVGTRGLGLAAGPADSVTLLTEPGDSVVVLGPDGGGRRLVLAWTGPEPLGEVHPLGDGFLALTGWSTTMITSDARAGVRADPTHLLRFGPDGALLDTLATLPGSEVGLFAIGGQISIAPPHFPRLTVIATDGERVVVGTGESDELRVLAPDGTLRAILRREGRDRRLTSADTAAARLFRRRIVGDNPLAARIVSELDRMLPLPAVRPPYAQLALDEAGRVWVGDYPPPGEMPLTWSVHDADGALIGRVALPVRFRLLDVAEGAVLGMVPGPGGGAIRVYDLLPPRP